jgi:hypothetical protein
VAGLDLRDEEVNHSGVAVAAAFWLGLVLLEAGGCWIHGGTLFGAFDQLVELVVVNQLNSGPADSVSCEYTLFVVVAGLDKAVGVKENRAGEVGEVVVLVVPGCAEVGDKVLVFSEFWVPESGEHFTVGVDVDSGVFGLV